MFSYGSVLRHKGVLKEGPDRYEQVGFYFSQSNIGGCERELYLQAKGKYEFNPAHALLGVFADGEAHEELTGHQLRKAGIEIIEAQSGSFLELPPHPLIESSSNIAGVAFNMCPVCGARIHGPCLHGHIDFVVRNPLTRLPEVIEHKAINSNWWDSTVKTLAEGGGSEFYGQHKRYAVQIGLYLVDLARKYKLSHTEGSLVFKNKNTARFLDVRMGYDSKRDVLSVVSADIEGNYIMTSDRSFMVRDFFSNVAVATILRIESALRDPLSRHTLPHGKKCVNCGAKECCATEFDVDLNVESNKIYVSDKEMGEKIRAFQSIQSRMNALEKEKRAIVDELESNLKIIAEKEGVVPVVLDPETGSCLTFQSWSRTDIDWDAVKDLSDKEKEIVEKLIRHKSGQYLRVKALTKQLEKKLNTAIPVEVVLETTTHTAAAATSGVPARFRCSPNA